MKNYFRTDFCLMLAAVLLLVSCQEEMHENFVSPEALNNNSPLTQRLLSATFPGDAVETNDNIIDSSACFSIRLPLEAVVNGQEMLLSSVEDYVTVAAIFAASNNDVDYIDLGFPITVTYPNGEEFAVANVEQYEILQQDCGLPVIVNSDCVGLIYPVSLSTYNSEYQLQSNYTVENDAALFQLLSNLGAFEIYVINYPMSFVNAFNQPVTVNNNAELAAAIQIAVENCSQPPILCSNILTEGLVMYLPFANSLTDLTGFGNPVATGPVDYVTDRSGNESGAISFEGFPLDNFIEVNGNQNNNMMQNNQFTISLWFNRQNAQLNEVPESLFSVSELSLQLYNQSNIEIKSPNVIAPGLVDPLYDINWIQSGMLGEVNIWHHLAVTWNGEVLRLYRDGVLRNSATGINFGQVLAGGMLGGQYKGYLDDVRIYKRALSSLEIEILSNLSGDVSTCLN